MASCPFMDLVQPLLDDSEWDIKTIQKTLECFTCHTQAYNHWQVCVRKFAMVNLHPEYVSRVRQVWYVAMLPVKFMILPDGYSGPVFDFGGLFTPKVREMETADPTVPRQERISKVITYGK